MEIYTSQHLGDREEQQDRVFCESDSRGTILLVADGVGGMSFGGQAAQAVSDTAFKFWQDWEPNQVDALQLLQSIAEASHLAIRSLGSEPKSGARSTLVCAAIVGSRCAWLSCGDSRLYHLNNEGSLWRTADHSVVQLLVDRGVVAEVDMGTHPDQGKLYQSLGGDADPEPDSGLLDLKQNDTLLLCSDGFWEHISKNAIQSMASMPQSSLASRVGKLVEGCYNGADGSSDNISLVVARQSDIRP